MQGRNNKRLGRTTRRAVLGALGLLLWASPGHAAEPAYTTGPTTTLPSSNTGWDYITLDQATGRLFIARRADGLTVWDTKAGKVLATVENSTGANGVVLVPEFGRGYTAMTDGTMLAFDLATLKPIERVKLDEGDLNQGFYDPATKRVHMVVGNRPARTTWISLDAATGKVVASIPDIGGADMVDHNKRNNQHYVAARNLKGGPVLGVIDAATNKLVQKILLTGGNLHSVASSEANGHVFVPVGSTGGDGTIHVYAPQ